MTSIFSDLIQKLENSEIFSNEEEKLFVEQMTTCKNAVKVIYTWNVLIHNKDLLSKIYSDVFHIVLNILQNVEKEIFSFEKTGYHLMKELKELKHPQGIDFNRYKKIDWNDYC